MTFRKIALTVAGLLAAALATAAVTVHLKAEDWAREIVDRRLAGSGFAVSWDSFAAGLLGSATLSGLTLRDGSSTLLQIETLRADLDFASLFAGPLRLGQVDVDHPVAWIDLIDGKPQAWERLRAALRKAPQDPQAPKRSLADRLGIVHVRGGEARAKVLGPAVWLTGPDVVVQRIDVTLDTARGGSVTAMLPPLAGQGKVAVNLVMRDGVLSSAEGRFEPPATYVAPPTMSERVAKDLRPLVQGLHWSAEDGAALREVSVQDLSEAPTTLVSAAWLRQTPDGGRLEQLDVLVSAARLRQGIAKLAPQGLPDELTPVLAQLGDLSGHVGAVQATRKDGGWDIALSHGAFTIRDAKAVLQRAQVQVGAKRDDGKRDMHVQMSGPILSLPRRSVWLQDPRLQDLMDEVLALRKVSEDKPDDDADDDPPPDAIAPLAATQDSATQRKPAKRAQQPPPGPSKAADKPPHGPSEVKERPPVRWQRQLRQGALAALNIRQSLEKRWPMGHWPNWLSLSIQGGQLILQGENGQPLIGLRQGALELGSQSGPLAVALEPFDRQGSWGRIAVEWRREPDKPAHHVEIQLKGGGVAQLLGSRLPGLSVGDGAELDARLSVSLPDDKHLDVAGHFDVARMGIQWWRLADRPIADFALSTVFEAKVTPTSMTLRTPDVRLGDAHMQGAIELVGLDGNPTIHLQLSAPMQDCGAMLGSIPASMTPTIGRVEAHGVMDWRVSLTTHLPGVGSTAVELALGDTLCVVDKLGEIDFDEFKRSDWVRPVNENGKILDDVLIGPGSGSWTSTMNMPGYVHYVMWATEDPFLKHRGISEDLLAKAIAIDLATGRFTYGGSTITQQLVKNIFLRRTKALSRKFEEMIIVWQMEKALGKARILEIYVNAVEFGPKIYGVTRAAWEFFQKRPADLRPKEAVYLAIIKPSPRSGWGTMRANGWGDWYEMKVGKYMDKLLADESISAEAYEADKPWKPAFNPPARGAKGPDGKH